MRVSTSFAVLVFLAAFAAGARAQGAAGPADEARDYGVAVGANLRLGDHASPTPVSIPGARLVSTADLRAALDGPPESRPLVFDVLGGTGHDSIPGAIWLADAGRGSSFEDEIQALLGRTLELLTRGNRARPMVFLCASPRCWLSYNAALRAVRLGYTAVGWYRGGIDAWVAAGGDTAPMRVAWRRPAGD